MKRQPDKARKNADPENKDLKSPYRGYGFNWLYIFLFAFMMIFYFVYNPTSNVKEIGWSAFESILTQHDIEKIVVVNKEVAEFYIKQDRLEDSKYKEVMDGIFSSITGPHYRMTIGSVENFENKLQQAQ